MNAEPLKSEEPVTIVDTLISEESATNEEQLTNAEPPTSEVPAISEALPLSPESFQAAFEIYTGLLKSLRLSRQLQDVITIDHMPLAVVKPLPEYPSTDVRAGDFHALMERFLLALRVVDGLRGVIAHPEAKSTGQPIISHWWSTRKEAFGTVVKKQLVPRALLSAWKGNQEILDDLSRFLNHCLYDLEDDLAKEAAQYAAERNAGIILFLAVFPNIPFIFPTIEIRLLFTKPLLNMLKAIRAIFGNFFILGFFLHLMELFAQLFDAIPRMQVRVVQEIVKLGWLENDKKRQALIHRYLKAVDARVAQPRVDAIARGLLSIVS